MALNLSDELRSFFGGQQGRRVVIVGIGSPIRHDDAVGLKINELLDGRLPSNVLLLQTETVPESYTGAIRDFHPTHVLLLDAANFNGVPGEGRIIPPKMIANVSVSTHSLPLNIFIDYIRKSICENVTLLGIQGIEIGFGEGITPLVLEGAAAITNLLIDMLGE